MRFSPRTIEEVKERANLIEVAEEFLRLRRQGGNFSGLCPFHTEKSPSFHIRDNGRFYHCFGCGASGDVISFLMQARGLSFSDAIQELASRFGVTVETVGGGVPGKDPAAGNARKERTFAFNSYIQKYFTHNFATAPDLVKRYLADRGFTEAAIQEFGIGFATADRTKVVQLLRSRKVNDDEIVQSGLARRTDRGELYDTFRSRITFPIFVERRRIAGFGGRIVPGTLPPEALAKAPKYLNSPETSVYQKSKILYGLPQSSEGIRRSQEVYLVEGYLDVIGLWQAGVRNAVATCGTAVTESHIKRLAYLAKRAVMLFDGDSAGITAAGKSFEVFLNSGLDTRAIFLPDGEDPDTFALQHGERTAQALQELPQVPLFDCFVEYVVRKLGAPSARELGAALKGRAAQEVSQLILRVDNAIERAELIERAALKLLIEPAAIRQLIAERAVTGGPRPLTAVSGQSTNGRGDAAEASEESGSANASSRPVSVEELPRLDRELLQVVMVLRRAGCSAVLADADLCSAVEPSTLQFVQALQALLEISAEDSPELKERIKVLLKEFGDSWVALWKQGHEMAALGVSFTDTLVAVRRAAKKLKLSNTVRALEQEIGLAHSEQEKMVLLQEKLQLMKQLSGM